MNTDTPVVSTVEAVLAALEANSGSKKGSKYVAGRVYTRHTPDVSTLVGVVLPPQARALVRILLEADSAEWTEAEMDELITEHADLLKTKQAPFKIFKYYLKRLEEAGFVSKNK